MTQLDEAQLESAARADPNARRPEPTAWRVEPAAPSPQAPRLGASLAELDLSRYGMQELKEHAARLEAAIARKQVEAKERIRSEMAKLASEEGLTLEEVLAAKRVDPG
ncbi:MAG: hypothetical protein OEM49_08315 [Myxococcales bacterium]|nr:hypothetical protein [Myxococcales bacterium]